MNTPDDPTHQPGAINPNAKLAGTPAESETPTPRTDEQVFYRDSQPVVEADFARQIERELSQARTEAERLKEERLQLESILGKRAHDLIGAAQEAVMDNAELRQQLAALQSKLADQIRSTQEALDHGDLMRAKSEERLQEVRAKLAEAENERDNRGKMHEGRELPPDIKKQPEILVKYANENPLLMSLLYDLDLMPEQVSDGSKYWFDMINVIDHFQRFGSAQRLGVSPARGAKGDEVAAPGLSKNKPGTAS